MEEYKRIIRKLDEGKVIEAAKDLLEIYKEEEDEVASRLLALLEYYLSRELIPEVKDLTSVTTKEVGEFILAMRKRMEDCKEDILSSLIRIIIYRRTKDSDIFKVLINAKAKRGYM